MDYVHRNDLVSREQLLALTSRSDGRAGAQLAVHLGAITATGGAVWWLWGSAWCAPLFVLHGMLLNWLYAAQHEMMHGTAFRTRALNEWGSRLTGLVVLFPRDLDRIAHFRHHRDTNDPARDPELADVCRGDGPPGAWAIAWRLLGLGYWHRRLRYVLGLAVGSPRGIEFMSPAERRTVMREARMHLAVYGIIAAGATALQTWAPVLLWLAPLVAARGTHEVQNMVEHGGRPMVPDILRSTRVIRTNPLMRRLGWNMQYHCHHHLFAAVPFYHLPQLHALIGARLPPGVSYFEALREIRTGDAA